MKRTTKQIFATAITTLMLLTLATGCKNSEGGKTPGSPGVPASSTGADGQPDFILTLAGLGVSQIIKNAVIEFNQMSLDYSIEVTDYYDFDSDPEVALTKLITEINSGKIPDILAYSDGLKGMDYEGKGLFADLYPFIDADPELDRGLFVQSVLRAVERDGKLYQAFPSFSINTVIGSPRILGSEPWWNLEEFAVFMDENPDAVFPMGYSVSKLNILDELLRFNIGELVDWENGTVSFESEGFIRLLEVCNRFPADMRDKRDIRKDAQAVAAGHQIMAQTLLYDFNEVNLNRALGVVWQDGEYIFKGYPTALENGHRVITLDALAISENSPNKDAAWSFVRTVLSPDWQQDNTGGLLVGFPSAQAALDRHYKNTLEDTNTYTYSLGITEPDTYTHITIGAPEPEDAEIISNLINSVSLGARCSIDGALMDIITSVASEYFNGARSAQDAANAIQDSAAAFMAEQS